MIDLKSTVVNESIGIMGQFINQPAESVIEIFDSYAKETYVASKYNYEILPLQQQTNSQPTGQFTLNDDGTVTTHIAGRFLVTALVRSKLGLGEASQYRLLVNGNYIAKHVSNFGVYHGGCAQVRATIELNENDHLGIYLASTLTHLDPRGMDGKLAPSLQLKIEKITKS